jgi:hypothetical protein
VSIARAKERRFHNGRIQEHAYNAGPISVNECEGCDEILRNGTTRLNNKIMILNMKMMFKNKMKHMISICLHFHCSPGLLVPV